MIIRAGPAGLHLVAISSPSLRLKASEGILIRFQAERARGTWPGACRPRQKNPCRKLLRHGFWRPKGSFSMPQAAAAWVFTLSSARTPCRSGLRHGVRTVQGGPSAPSPCRRAHRHGLPRHGTQPRRGPRPAGPPVYSPAPPLSGPYTCTRASSLR